MEQGHVPNVKVDGHVALEALCTCQQSTRVGIHEKPARRPFDGGREAVLKTGLTVSTTFLTVLTVLKKLFFLNSFNNISNILRYWYEARMENKPVI